VKKNEYLRALKRELKALPRDERKRQLAYYEELFEDMREDGIGEEEAAASLERPSLVARAILSDTPPVQRKRRGWKIALIIVLCVVLANAAVLAVGQLLGMWTNVVSLVTPYLEFDSAYSADNTYSVPMEGIDSVVVLWEQGSVTVVPGGGDSVTFHESARHGIPQSEALSWGVQDGTLYIQFRSPSIDLRRAKDLTVTLPEQALQQLRTESGSATVEITGARAEVFRVDTASGNVNCAGIDADTVELHGASGDVIFSGACRTLEAVTASGRAAVTNTGDAEYIAVTTVSGFAAFHNEGICGKVSISGTSGGVYLENRSETPIPTAVLENVSGSVMTEGAVDSITVTTVSGDIVINSLTYIPRSVAVETTSAHVDVILPAGTGFTVDFESVSGHLSSAYGEIGNGGTGTYRFGDGAVEIRIRTTSGDAFIDTIDPRFRDAA